jgi:hypothetical protein
MINSVKSNTSSFCLQKWYLDCVSENGEVFIGYSAKLDWKSLGLAYASFLDFDGGRSKSGTSLLKECLPEISGDCVVWESENLACSGKWQNIGSKLPALKLFENDVGSVIWNARFPLSEVRIKRSGSELVGLGYAEKLDLTIPPWRLPIEELRWGRFISKDIYVVWVEWSGSQPLRVVYLNGRKIKDATVSDNGVHWEGGTLQHKQFSVLREGPLVATVLPKIPGIRTIFPEKILNMHERKWLSSSVFMLNGITHRGWTIHEIVQF